MSDNNEPQKNDKKVKDAVKKNRVIGKAIVCMGSIKADGDEITPKDLNGGQETFDRLVKAKRITLGK